MVLLQAGMALAAKMCDEHLKAEKDKLLPVNSGIDNSNIESQINSYNNTMLRRNSLVANSSEENPLVLDLDENLAAMRQAIISSIDNQLVTLNNQLASVDFHQILQKQKENQ